jgi:predicted aconitase with swiveling domain
MRRLLLGALSLLFAVAATAGTPYSLDRGGTLWSAAAQPEGLLLTAQRDGAEIVRSLVPFPAATAGAQDIEISVAADELTGKVAVLWQREWSAGVSDIMLGVWSAGAWERVATLSADMSEHPRFPAAQLSRVSSTVPASDGGSAVVEESFLHAVWWTGSGPSQHGSYALLRLSADAAEPDAIVTRNLDDLVWLGTGCAWPAPASILERPLFASQAAGSSAFLFHGSRRACLFQLLEVSFRLEDAPGPIVTAQRKRHTPVFGVRKMFGVPASMSLEGARILLGDDLNPVAYRVVDGTIEYISSSGIRWTPKRSLAVDGALTIDRAIPLVEHLAR